MLESTPSVHATSVLDRREPGPGIVVLGLHAARLARAVRPGQYVMAVPPMGGTAAAALAIYEAEGERISLMLVVVGPRSAELAALPVGSALDLLGPLGNGFDLEALGDDIAIVAGGVGLASVLLLAERAVSQGRRAHLYYGARNAAALVDTELFELRGVGVTLTTDDGSRGRHGYVTDALAKADRDHSAIAACGPTPMLRAVARISQASGARAQLSLEEAFACGVGACWGCVVAIDRKSPQAPRFPHAAGSAGSPDAAADYVHARICKEGPVFWAHDLRW